MNHNSLVKEALNLHSKLSNGFWECDGPYALNGTLIKELGSSGTILSGDNDACKFVVFMKEVLPEIIDEYEDKLREIKNECIQAIDDL